MYYIVRESVNNALKHARGIDISIELYADESQLYIIVKNDINPDCNMNNQSRKRDRIGLGIGIMQYRAILIGANLTIQKNNKEYKVIVEIARE